MGLRETMNNNPAAVTGGAVVILLICLLWLGRGMLFGGGVGDTQIVYFDVASNQVKLVQYSRENPLLTPLSGTTTYMAQILACGECGEITDGMTVEDLKAKNMFVGWVWKTDPNPSPDQLGFDNGTQYRILDSEKWYPGSSNAWYTLQERQLAKCPGDSGAAYCDVNTK